MAIRQVVERCLFDLSGISRCHKTFTTEAMARKMIDFSKLTSSQLIEFKNRYHTYIFDVNGCLIDFELKPIEGVNEVLQEMACNEKCIMVFTDNCLHTLSSIAAKVNAMFPSIRKENVMSSGYLSMLYLKDINFQKKIYVMGSEFGIVTELKNNGFHVLHDEELRKMTVPDLRKEKFEDGVGAVLIAADVNFNYFKMFKAANYLKDPEVLLLQSHFPIVVQYNPIILAAGAIAPSVKAASRRTETICLGKGSEYACKYLNSLALENSRCLFVGDDLSSDVVAGNLCGMDTMFVLSGNSTLEMVEHAKANTLLNRIPTYYTNSVGDLMKAFKTKGEYH